MSRRLHNQCVSDLQGVVRSPAMLSSIAAKHGAFTVTTTATLNSVTHFVTHTVTHPATHTITRALKRCLYGFTDKKYS